MEHGKIVVIDDEANIRQTIKEALEGEGYEVSCYGNPLQGLEAALQRNPDLIITDLIMPDLDGLKVIEQTKAVNPETNVVVITGHASLESAIGSIRAGASDYLVKPFRIAELLSAVKKALSQKRFISCGRTARNKTFHERYRIQNLIGTTPEMKEIFKLIEKVAKTDSTVLIIGESGTGKEMVARSIHYQSKRRKQPFVSINCAALPESLLESELFGYEQGAFTGAVASKVGLFELAELGTLLLDEVAEMSTSLQVKLLRILQERVLRRLGGIKEIPVDFRLIAATSKNLPEAIKAGRFREELFYRLNVIPIVIPPLRKRSDDVPAFVTYFLEFYARKHGRNRQAFEVTKEAMTIFQNYRWPGNVRELENVMERMVALAERDTIDAQMVEKAIQTGNFSSQTLEPITTDNDLREALESYERDLIEKAIRQAGGNKNKAARVLHLTRQGLQYKINKYRISSAFGQPSGK